MKLDKLLSMEIWSETTLSGKDDIVVQIMRCPNGWLARTMNNHLIAASNFIPERLPVQVPEQGTSQELFVKHHKLREGIQDIIDELGNQYKFSPDSVDNDLNKIFADGIRGKLNKLL